MEIYDCTLREGEQSSGASFDLNSRIELFKELDDFGFDYIELGWPVASKEILKSFELCRKERKKAKIVAFGSTSIKENFEEDENLKSILESKPDYACIFGKTWKQHVEKQLRITPEQNLARISGSILFLKNKGIEVFYDAEHYFDAFKSDKEYAILTLAEAANAGAERIILCDTNGGILPEEAKEIIEETKEKLLEKGINASLGVHFHNDSGLALANTLSCLNNVVQVQGTINGIGERIGNLNFSEFLPVYAKKLHKNINIDLTKLKEINENAYKLSCVEIPLIRTFVGDTAFAHKGGVHIDAINKGASYEHANPEDFGNKRIILLNSLGGKAGIISVAKQFGYDLDKKNPDVQKKADLLFNELRELESKGYNIGTIEAEQFLLIEKYFGNLKEFFSIEKWKIETEKENNKEKSNFYVQCRIDNDYFEDKLNIDGGPVDAAYKTLFKLLQEKYPEISNLKLVDFHVCLARRKREESSVRTLLTFEDDEKFQTAGVDSNILQSAIEALGKGFKYYLNKIYKESVKNV